MFQSDHRIKSLYFNGHSDAKAHCQRKKVVQYYVQDSQGRCFRRVWSGWERCSQAGQTAEERLAGSDCRDLRPQTWCQAQIKVGFCKVKEIREVSLYLAKYL
ncbi:unnamed protein product [Protopolystoma xenopodis]|uniref:Uncharacterized protein n=1 Tax=Protopolystoma xenopodis TaxID=117903 RepID=A0A3S5ASQ5_9PLAT|nr:unnamed protein product [Protopolystoma xenopodis]